MTATIVPKTEACLKVSIHCRPLALGAGGMERTAATLANHLAENGCQVQMVYCDAPHPPAYPLHDRIEQCRLKWPDMPEKFARAAATFGADVALHLYPDASAIPYIRALVLTDIPVVLHEATSAERLVNLGWAQYFDMDLAAAKAQHDAISAVAARVRVTLEDYRIGFPPVLQQRTHSFPNAFAPASPALLAERNAPRDPRFIHIGGLKPNKNLQPAIRAFLRIANRLPHWRFAVFSDDYGEGVRQEIDQICAASPYGNRVDLFPSTPDIFHEYARSDVHVISSLKEGLPNCVAEAMRHGVPSIGFASCTGTNRLIRDGQNGLLVDDSSAQADRQTLAALREDGLADAMLKLATNMVLRHEMGSQAAADSTIFDPAVIFTKWENLLVEAASQPGYVSRLAAHDPLLADRGCASIGRVLVTDLGFSTLPIGLRQPVAAKLWMRGEVSAEVLGQSCNAPDRAQGYLVCGDPLYATGLEAAAKAAAQARADIAICSALPEQAQSGAAMAPAMMDPDLLASTLSAPHIVLVSLDLLRQVKAPEPPETLLQAAGIMALANAGAVTLCAEGGGATAEIPADQPVKYHLAQIAQAAPILQHQGARAGLRAVSDLFVRLLAPRMAGALASDVMDAWRIWLQADPDVIRRAKKYRVWGFRAALLLNGYPQFAARPEPLAGLSVEECQTVADSFTPGDGLRPVALPMLRRRIARLQRS